VGTSDIFFYFLQSFDSEVLTDNWTFYNALETHRSSTSYRYHQSQPSIIFNENTIIEYAQGNSWSFMLHIIKYPWMVFLKLVIQKPFFDYSSQNSYKEKSNHGIFVKVSVLVKFLLSALSLSPIA
jgi:hypothetical protein